MTQAAPSLFTADALPALVFGASVTSCAWVSFDALCCSDGWSLLSALAQQHGDASVQVIDLDEPRLLTPASRDEYQMLCDDELIGASVVRWCGSSGRWGIHGSRGLEIAVAGQVDNRRWPRTADCRVLSIDSALRLVRTSDHEREQLLTTYDAASWDPAEESPALPELVEVCRQVQADAIDPIVALRRLNDLLDRAPKSVRRIEATSRLHRAYGRTGYLLMGEARAPFGPLLLAQNDRNHAQHSADERALVRQACDEILAAV